MVQLDKIDPLLFDDLCLTVLERATEYFKQPGVQEEYEAWLAERNRQREEADSANAEAPQ